MLDPADAPDPDLVYRNHLETCRHLGIEPVPRDQALALTGEWTDVLNGGTQNRRRISAQAAFDPEADMTQGRIAPVRAAHTIAIG